MIGRPAKSQELTLLALVAFIQSNGTGTAIGSNSWVFDWRQNIPNHSKQVSLELGPMVFLSGKVCLG